MKKVYKYAVPVLCLLIGLAIGLSFGSGGQCGMCMALDAQYEVEGTQVRLQGGSASGEVWNIAAEYLPATGDLNDDEKEDMAMVLHYTDDTGMDRQYLVCALRDKNEMAGSNAVYLGDKVSITGLQIESGMIWVSMGVPGENGQAEQRAGQYAYYEGKLNQVG